MENDDTKSDQDDELGVSWSSHQKVRSSNDRRANSDRRLLTGRAISVPNMRVGHERRADKDRRKVKLTITGRAMDA